MFFNDDEYKISFHLYFLFDGKSQIPLKMNDKKQGLGCESSSSNISATNFNDPKQKQKVRILEKTHQRYHASEATVDIFKNCSDESD